MQNFIVPVVDVTPNFRFEINGLAFLLIAAGLVVDFLAFESLLTLTRGRLFNLFKLLSVVVSLSFSFVDLSLSLTSSVLDGRRLSGDVRALPGNKRFDGRLKFRRDVGFGAIEAASTGFSSPAAFSTSFDSVVDAVVWSLRPRLRRLNCGLGFNKRDCVELSGSADFSVVVGATDVRRLNRFLALLPNRVDDVFAGASLFSTVSLTSSGALVEANVFVEREPEFRDENEDEGRLNRFLGFDDSVDASAAEDSVDVGLFDWNLKRLRPAVNPPRPFGASVEVVVEGASVVVVVVVAVVVDFSVVVVDGLSVSASIVVSSSSLEMVVAS